MIGSGQAAAFVIHNWKNKSKISVKLIFIRNDHNQESWMSDSIRKFDCQIFQNGSVIYRSDSVVIEEPLEIRIIYGIPEKRADKSIAVTMRTPGCDAELATGFLFTEGIIRKSEDVLKIHQGLDLNVINVELLPGLDPELKKMDRNFYTTSSCGVCGKSSIDAIRLNCPPVQSDLRVQSNVLLSLPAKLRSAQEIFESTGGLHAAALVNQAGQVMVLREDVGRHNATDKVIGSFLQGGLISMKKNILMLSGRISFELVQKAAMAGIPVVAGVGAPSSLAIELAQEMNMTVIGFMRDGRFNHYCGNNVELP